MRKSKGFTLIEVMVVLSILALIAILAYNFFGSTMKEAKLKQQTTKLFNDLRIIGDAYDLYTIKNGTAPTANLVVIDGTAADFRDLGGMTKAVPVADSSAVNWGIYQWTSAYDDLNGDAVSDAAASTGIASDELCLAYNAAYANHIGIYDYQADGYPAGVTTFCTKWFTAHVDNNEIIWVLALSK